MTHLFIDRQAVAFTQSVQTWAELLTEVDRTMDARGRVLTEVQFDGVGDPTYRETDALTRPLSGIGRIDAVTATPDDLVRECLLEAAGTVSALCDEAMHVSEQFRSARRGDAHDRLGRLASELGQLVVLVQTLQGPLGLDLSRLDSEADAHAVDMAGLGSQVDALVAAQGGADYYAIADILEYDLLPFLRTWQTRFERLAG